MLRHFCFSISADNNTKAPSHPSRFSRWAWFALVGLCSLSPGLDGTYPNAHGMTVLRLNDASLVELSSLVIRGKVLQKQSKWNAKGLAIITQVTVQVLEEIMGRKAPATLIVGHYGGRVGSQEMGTHFSPRFVVGEEVLLFLHQSKHLPGEYLLTGWTQGKWTIRRPDTPYSSSSPLSKATIHRQMAPTRLVVPTHSTLQATSSANRNESLSSFVTKLRGYWKVHLKKQALKKSPTRIIHLRLNSQLKLLRVAKPKTTQDKKPLPKTPKAPSASPSHR